jgi:hypothetical protein
MGTLINNVMNFNRHIRRGGALLLAVFLCGSGGAKAADLVDAQSFEGVNGLFPLVFNQFNPAWGVLNSVSVTFTLYSNGGVLRFDNDGGTAASGNVRFGSDGNIYSEDLTGDEFEPLTLVARAASPNTLISADVDDGDIEVGGTPNFSFEGDDYAVVNGGNYSASRTSDLSDYLAGFIGVGTYTITAEASQFVSASAFGGAQQQIDPSSVSGSVVITYNYTGDGPPPPDPPPGDPSAVPEPSTMALMLAAAVSLRLVVRRRR